MKEIGMLFSGPMVRAILDGRKTQTRRIINPQPRVILAQYNDGSIETNQIFRHGDQRLRCQVHPGDRIYVRETWGILEDKHHYCYFVDPQGRSRQQLVGNRWRPSIHMPKAAARIWLEVTDVRPERLQDISEKDAIAEGIDMGSEFASLCIDLETAPYSNDLVRNSAAITVFKKLWESTCGSWDANPWVWVIEFQDCQKNFSERYAEKALGGAGE